MRTVPSSPVVAATSPFGVNATAVTSSLCPGRAKRSLPVAASQTYSPLFALAAATADPSAETASAGMSPAGTAISMMILFFSTSQRMILPSHAAASVLPSPDMASRRTG